MARLLQFFVLILFLAACSDQNGQVDSELVSEVTTEDAEMDPPGTYPEIAEFSRTKLKPIASPWESRNIFCSEDPSESFHEIRAIDRDGEISYVVFSSIEHRNGFTFYFNEFDGMGELMSRHELERADYSLRDKINLQRHGDYLCYFTSLESRIAKYFSLVTGEHGDTTDNMIEWDLHGMENITADFTAPNGSLVITLYSTKLVLRDLTDKSTDTLINQEYRGSWSFGRGSWDDKSTKFYFDNSGAVACIWEVDVERKTLNKIVPEHYADHPFFFNKDSTTYIAYCENNCIKVTTPRNKN